MGSTVSPGIRQVPCVMQHANEAISEVRKAEFFRKGGAARELIKGKHWLLLTRWVHLNTDRKRQLNKLFALNRKVMKAYLLKESLDRLWSYTYEGAMLRYLQSWIDQLRWQRLKPIYGEAGADAAESPGGTVELLQDQSSPGGGGSSQWKHQSPITSWSRLSRSQLLAAEGAALGSHQDRIRRFSESRVVCALLQIVVQNHINPHLPVLTTYRPNPQFSANKPRMPTFSPRCDTLAATLAILARSGSWLSRWHVQFSRVNPLTSLHALLCRSESIVPYVDQAMKRAMYIGDRDQR
jgi:hypothetical protein